MPPSRDTKDPSASGSTFQNKVWIAVTIAAFMAIVLLLIYSTFKVLLLVMAGSLIAVFFRALSSKIQRKTKWKEGICVAISIISTLLVLAGLFLLIGAKVQDQMVELTETIPKTIDKAKATLNESSIGQSFLDKAFSKESLEKAQVFLQEFFQSTFGLLGDLYVVLFIGIFFTVSPQTYIKGVVQIIPIRGQEKAREVINALGEQLRKWLKGILFAMLIVFILTAIGLAIIGIPLWLVLAILAGILCFIPNFGPLLSVIPAVLVGLLQGPQTALFIIGLYVLIQFVESNFITTMIQKKLVNMPPALLLIGQLIMGVLAGGWGLVLATPITLIIMVLVKELYIKNGEEEKS